MVSEVGRQHRNPWLWVPSLYFAEGIPYVVVMLVSVIMYKRLGVSNTQIALYTSLLYWPWVIKPLWSPFVDTIRTRRSWILWMQLLIGAGLACVALTIPASDFLRYTLAFLTLLAFSSATHDIAADGFYMLGLSTHDQAWFVGIRSTFYRLAMITGQGLLVIVAGSLETATGLPPVNIDLRAVSEAQAPVGDSTVVARQRDEQELNVSQASIPVAIAVHDPAGSDSIIAVYRASNVRRGFYQEEVAATGEPSWWSSKVSRPLAEWLRRYFAVDQEPLGLRRAGTVAVTFVSLSQPPDEGQTIVVNTGLESGDPSIRLVEGQRAVFSEENWNQRLALVFQLDPKLDAPSEARFVARSGNIPLAWSITFYLLAGLFVVAALYHRTFLPRPATDIAHHARRNVFAEFLDTFRSFFRKDRIGVAIAFFLLYRFAEAQLVKLASPFLLDSREVGGLALTTGEVGFAYGTVGILALTAGGLIGGFLAARHGLKKWLWPMVIAINVPNLVYLFLAMAKPESLVTINACVAVEQFGYGFGFTAFMLYMIYVADGPHKTAHFAICTGFMALGMMLPGMFSGWLQDIIGYRQFFLWIMLATIPGFIVTALIPLRADFGKKTDE
jgi:PAT family beta-lactamase induction signal transducer AmpG